MAYESLQLEIHCSCLEATEKRFKLKKGGLASFSNFNNLIREDMGQNKFVLQSSASQESWKFE